MSTLTNTENQIHFIRCVQSVYDAITDINENAIYWITDKGKIYLGSILMSCVIDSHKVTPQMYSAKGDGVTDDTEAFQSALAENREVYVPEGTYILSDTLTIKENCMFELSQGAVLKFTQTGKNCIAMTRLSNIKGNHATIIVPYAFNANVIHASTDVDTLYDENGNVDNTVVPPFTKWGPQWKTSRYITDLNICKPDIRGFHYSVDGDCYGTAIYINCDSEDELTFMWGVNMNGIRIAGGFTYGIRIHNEGTAWNHDMRIEAVIDACETAVSVENCNTLHLAATIQPRRAYSMSEVYKPYAKYGIKIVDSIAVDLTECIVWDWDETNTLWTIDSEYQHIAMYGDCRGLVLSDFLYYESVNDIRDLIYTDTPSNLEKMSILQEPITRWFKPKDGEPYFSDGFTEKKIALTDDIDRFFETNTIPLFTDVLATAIDTDGTIFKGIGYTKSGYIAADGTFEDNSTYQGCTGYIPIKNDQTLYADGMSFNASTSDNNRIVVYDSDFAKLSHTNRGNLVSNTDARAVYSELENGFSIQLKNLPNAAYIRITLERAGFSDSPRIAIDEEIAYTEAGFLVDDVKVKTENISGLSNKYQQISNKVTAISASSTDAQYPSAKAVYTVLQNALGEYVTDIASLIGGDA